jgi:hypothetical protein
VVEVDPRLTAPVEIPELRGDTWRDVGILATEQRALLFECNARFEAIRQSTGE